MAGFEACEQIATFTADGDGGGENRSGAALIVDVIANCGDRVGEVLGRRRVVQAEVCMLEFGWGGVERDGSVRGGDGDVVVKAHVGAVEASVDPGAHRVIATGEEPRVMGVETLDSAAGSAHAAIGSRAVMVIGNQRVALGGITLVGGCKCIRIDGCLCRANAAR